MSMDVAVVGAGPGGAWTAYKLAERGARVLLIDPSHPREKPCGGGVTGRALALVSAALQGFDVRASIIRTARFVDSASGRSASVPLACPDVEFPPDLIVASRAEFDRALVDAARERCVEILPARVTDVAAGHGGFRIATTAGSRDARYLVGADGANSLVRRRLAAPFTRDRLSIATGYFAHGTTSDEIVVELAADPPGYFWSFPRPTHLAIGVCAQADAGVTPETLRGRVRSWIDRHALAPRASLEPYSWPIPSLAEGDFDDLTNSGPGWFLVGDAAGLVDPITREGIYFALLSGEWAADEIASGDPYASERYAQRVWAGIGSELSRAAALKSAFFRPEFIALMTEALAASASIRRVMADLVAGRQSYETLKWRLLRTCELGFALRLARRYLET
jgi:geranylgeranyl reductase family protein